MPLYYGRTLTDYLPSLSIVASYVLSYSIAKSYYDIANKIYQTKKDLYNTYNTKIKPAIDFYNQFYNIFDPKLSINNLLPLLAGGPPHYQKLINYIIKDLEIFKKERQEMLKQIER
jgi:hypothetical protein